MAIGIFKADLPAEHDLRKSLTGKPVTSICQLMDRIDKYRRVEEDQQQGKGKTKVIPQERRDFRSDQYNNNRPRKDFVGQSGGDGNGAGRGRRMRSSPPPRMDFSCPIPAP